MPRSGMLLAAAATVLLAVCQGAKPPTPACSLNGQLHVHSSAAGGAPSCVCDKPWSGAQCETMNFQPVTFPQGYGMKPNLTSWGGNTIYDGATQKYHMFVSAMTNGCPLSTWGHNSRIEHATSDSITGPYEFVDVAVNTWAHNAAPIALKDGTFAIIHIGTGTGPPNGGSNCTHTEDGHPADHWNTDTPLTFDSWRTANKAAGSTIHVAKTLDGPWTPLTNSLGSCNNPAPWVHPNGTIYCVCGGELRMTNDLTAPWTTVTSFSHSGGPSGNYEDPFLYTTDRGWHLIYHVYSTSENPPHGHECFNATVSAHGFSPDGHNWYMSATSPYGTQVQLTTGETVTVATRERPKVYFDKDWKMTHLVNGVCSASACPNGPKTGCVDCKYANWDYTLIQPLAV